MEEATGLPTTKSVRSECGSEYSFRNHSLEERLCEPCFIRQYVGKEDGDGLCFGGPPEGVLDGVFPELHSHCSCILIGDCVWDESQFDVESTNCEMGISCACGNEGSLEEGGIVVRPKQVLAVHAGGFDAWSSSGLRASTRSSDACYSLELLALCRPHPATSWG
jgi:hypothetical protein